MGKVLETIRYLKKENTKLLFCTGRVMTTFLESADLGVKRMENFVPGHASGLSNDFGAFANWDVDGEFEEWERGRGELKEAS